MRHISARLDIPPPFIASATAANLLISRLPGSDTVARAREAAWVPLMSLVTLKLTADDVRKAVELFWTTFLAKSEEELNDF